MLYFKRFSQAAAALSLAFACAPSPESLLPYAGAAVSGERALIPGTGTAEVETYLQNRADTRLVAGLPGHILYKGGLGTENVSLHYGINGWNNVQTVPMTPAQMKTGAVQADIVLPREARTLEFAFVKRDSSGEYWDNNAQKDWNTDVFQSLSDAQLIHGENPVWRITYIGLLSSPMAHVGADGWKNVRDVAMYKDGTIERNTGVTAYWTDIPAGSEERLDWCFRDAPGNWDNNNGRDWRALKAPVSAELWPAAETGMLYYYDLMGKPVHSWLNGVYKGAGKLYLTHSGAYFSAQFTKLAAGDWLFVLDETVSGVRYYAEVRTRIDRVGANVSLPVVVKTL